MQFTFPVETLPMTIDEYLDRPERPSVSYLVDAVLPAGGKTMIYGQPKAGKTYIAVSLAMAVANPNVSEWFGWPVLNHGPSLYLSLDSAPGEWGSIYMEAARKTPLYSPQMPFYHVDNSMPPAPFDIENAQTRARDYIMEAVYHVHQQAGQPPVFVVVDNFRNLYWGKENESEVQMRVMSLFSACCPDSALLMSHHGKKDPLEGAYDIMSGSRGSNFLPGNSSTIFRISARPDGLRGKLEYTGRGCGSGVIRIMRPAPFDREDKGSPNNFWQVDFSQDQAILTAVLNEMEGKTVSQMAEELASRLSCTKEGARARISRALGHKK